MQPRKDGKGIGRRTFLKTLGGVAAFGIASTALRTPPMRIRRARAGQPGDFGGCRIVVFGSDSLRVDYAQTLLAEGAPALTYLSQFNPNNPIICSLNNGRSSTQPGWATIWSGMPSFWTRAFANREFEPIPRSRHVMNKLSAGYKGQDMYLAWITGKGHNIAGEKKKDS